MMRFDRQTEEILCDAGTLARKLGHSYVGSEHILLALSARQDTPAGQILQSARADHTSLSHVLRQIYGTGDGGRRLPQGLSSGAQRVIRTAAEQARCSGAPTVRPEHLLLAISAENSCTAALMLVGCGVCIEQVHADSCICISKQDHPEREKRGQSMRLLEQFGINLLDKVEDMEPVIGREQEINTVIQILCRKHKNNPALVGEPGVGKTAIVEGLAQRLAAGSVPEQLRSKRLISLDTASMVAGTKYRGEFEERMRDIMAEVIRSGNIILFIDEMHTLVGAGAAEGAIDAANIMKPALGRGELQMIGATTVAEYRKYIEKDAALERRFRQVPVGEPSEEQTTAILRGLRPGLEKHHGLAISDEAIRAAVQLSGRYLTEYYWPDKALDLLDEGAAHAKLAQLRVGLHAQDRRRLELDRHLRSAIAAEDFEKALQIQNQIQDLHQPPAHRSKKQVEYDDVAAAVSVRTGIPAGSLSATEQSRLLQLEQTLCAQVVGQQKAVHTVACAVRRGRSGIAETNRPAAAILLTGPTGVGKTQLCKALAEAVYGDRHCFVRLDMTEYMEKHSVARLLGAPPGYVGHEEGGLLTERVRRNPYSLVLFDEIEKAHPDVTGILLQIMEDGVLTDHLGHTVNFKNTIIMLTANLGGEETVKRGMGFLPASGHQRVMAKLQEHFPAEFLGRLDAIAVFEPLSETALREIADRQLRALQKRAEAAGIVMELEAQAAVFLAAHCVQQGIGARALRHMLQEQVEDPLAERCLRQQERSPLRVRLVCGETQLRLLDAVQQ